MRTILAILALSATSATARDDSDAKKPVTVYIEHNAAMATGTLSLAQAISRDMFRNVNVDLHWQTGRPTADAVVVEITTKTCPSLHPGALAYAEPFEGEHIRVFYDRVENMAGEQLAPRLLAHVFVHEITHILEGLDRHSPTGVMKAHWTDEDVAGMARRSLSFDAADVELIKVGLDHRNKKMIAGKKTVHAEPQMNVALCSLGSVGE